MLDRIKLPHCAMSPRSANSSHRIKTPLKSTYRFGLCSGERPFRLSIVDQIIVPAYIRPGKYVLGFRWDCEETAQIWSTCSDIEISI
jgi:hypothetical protein